MSNQPASNQEITDKIRSGEFFRESQKAYHLSYHDPMTERYFFMGITAVAVLIFILSLAAIILIHPLKMNVPFIYTSEDVVEDLPRITPLGTREQDPNVLLKQFLATNYLKLREEYSVDTVDRNKAGVKSQSTDEVNAVYLKQMSPSNPNSPVSQYQRRAVRVVTPTDFRLGEMADDEQVMTIYYKEQVIAGADIGARNKRAIITFSFDDIEVNQDTGEASKLAFTVVDYQTEDVN